MNTPLKTCTCGVGPWAGDGLCDACGGLDLGLPRKLLTEAEARVAARQARMLRGGPAQPASRYVCDACEFETQELAEAKRHINEQRWHWVSRAVEPDRADRLVAEIEAAVRRYWSGEE